MKPFVSALVVTTGGRVSRTAIWKRQLARLPELSTATQLAAVGASSEMFVPDGGVHVTDAPQLSVTVGAKLATAPSALHSSVWSAGQTMTGGVVSTTDTVPVHEVTCCLPSVQVSVTNVAPSPNWAALWVQVPSFETALIEALPWQEPSADTVTFWHLAHTG